MKKMIILMLTLMLCLSAAYACGCEIDPAVRLAAMQMASLDLDMEPEQLADVSAVALGLEDACNCEGLRTVMLTLMVEHQELLTSHFSAAQREAMRAYMIRCGCCAVQAVEEQAKEQKPAGHTHRGGTHANGGKCSSCGRVYQTHTVTMTSLDNSRHVAACSCGWKGETENHKAGQLLGTESNGLGRYKCSTCGATLYWHILREYEWTDCCDCHCGPCCEGCECGCTAG